MFIHLNRKPSALDSYIFAASIILADASNSAVAKVTLAMRSRSACAQLIGLLGSSLRLAELLFLGPQASCT